MKEKKQYNFLMKVPNNHFGLSLIEEMKKHLNKDSYRLRLRGTNPDWEKAKKDGIPTNVNYFRVSTPLKYAKEIRVYICAKLGNYYYGVVAPMGIDYVKLRFKGTDDAEGQSDEISFPNNRCELG
jgi:hypothetical protein